LRQQHHSGREANPLGRGRDERVGDKWIRDRECRREERVAARGAGIAVDRFVEEHDVFAQPEFDEAEIFCSTRDVTQLPRRDTRRRDRQVETELH
jgi:hypothetical protein